MLHPEIRKNVRRNFIVNILDGAFFGLALGFASSDTIIPLFLNKLTDSTLLIGLFTSMHFFGWQFPQLLTANHVARLRRYKPMVLMMTLHERWPYLGLALIALLIPVLNINLILVLTFIMLAWQGFGGGFTATAWQSMVSKIMPRERIGTFFGAQSAAANLLASGGAILAGLILERLIYPHNFALCFLITGLIMMISFAFLAQTREPAHEIVVTETTQPHGWRTFLALLKRDTNFRWFLLARALAQVAWMSIPFYTVYAVRVFNMSVETVSFMGGLLFMTQTVSNLVLGWAGDRWGHRIVFIAGVVMVSTSTVLALVAPDASWFYLVFTLAGLSRPAIWSVAMSFTLEFGETSEKPLYIGLTNTLIAPMTLAPSVGGWLAQQYGFPAMFLVAVLFGLMTIFLVQFVVRTPLPKSTALTPPLAVAEGNASGG